MRPLVIAHVDCDLYHSSYVMTGLLELAADGQIDLEFRFPASIISRHRGRFTVRLDIHDRAGGDLHRMCIDLHDANDYFCEESLRDCELYFKRSYNRLEIGKLPLESRHKILPFGPNFGCTGKHERSLFLRRCGSVMSHIQRIGGWHTLVRKRGFYGLYTVGSVLYKRLLPLQEYESDLSGDGVQTGVYFNARLFPEDSGPIAALNKQRVRLVRSLRAEFGDRYLGGLIPGAMVPADCVSNSGCDRKSHAASVKSSLVCIYTNGLNDSIGWKLGEYFASSKCVVAEPLCNELAAPLVDGRDIFYFNSTDECVAHCLRLMNDPELAREVRKRIADYYASFVRPDRNLWRVISRAVTVPALTQNRSVAVA